MKKQRNNSIFVNSVLHIIGLCLCIAPPAVCTLMYFPLWKNADAGTNIAGGCALLLVLCAMPLFKLLKRHFSSAASYVFWLASFLLFFALSKIAHEMTVISFVGFVSNAVGAVFFAIARRNGARDDE